MPTPQDTTQSSIQQKLAELQPEFLRVENESYKHNVPPGAESHFKVTIVSEKFNAQPLLARHRLVNEILAAELAGGVHALALHTMTPQEWAAHGATADSPPCLGGDGGDKVAGTAAR